MKETRFLRYNNRLSNNHGCETYSKIEDKTISKAKNKAVAANASKLQSNNLAFFLLSVSSFSIASRQVLDILSLHSSSSRFNHSLCNSFELTTNPFFECYKQLYSI